MLPQLVHLYQLPFGTINMPHVEQDGASPRPGIGLLARVAFESSTMAAPGSRTASSFEEVLGLRYSDEMNLPPSQRAM